MFKHVKVGKHIEYMRQKLSKNMLKISSRGIYTSFFLFFIPAFLAGMSSSRDKISSRQKRINKKRHFTIDRDDFILT